MADKIANKRIAGSLRRRTEAISFLHSMMSGQFQSLDDEEVPPWFEEGEVQQVSGTVYTYHRECRRVCWRDGLKFAWANEGQPFVLFWITDCDYFARQLTEEETFRFCQLLDVKRTRSRTQTEQLWCCEFKKADEILSLSSAYPIVSRHQGP